MMRRLIALLLLGSVLLACGTPEAAPTPTRQTTASYPTPAEAAPSPVPAIMTPMPTALVSATVTPTPRLIELTPVTTTALTATLVQSIPLDAKQMPTTLVGWSPDERYLMYVQGKAVDPKTKMDVGRLWVLDLTTGQPTMIIDDGVVVGHNSNSESYEVNLPQWDEECCTIIASFLEHEQQVVRRLDVDGTSLEEVARPLTPSLVRFFGGNVHRVEGGQAVINGNVLKTPLISQSAAITATSLVRDGVYTHNNRDVQYLDATTTWIMRGNETFLKDATQAEPIGIINIMPSPDGMWLAIITGPRVPRDRDLWVVNRITNEYIQIGKQSLFAYPRWSSDTRFLTYNEGEWLSIVDMRSQYSRMIGETFNGSTVWHPERIQFAIINPVNQSIDIFDVISEEK